ncbi:MAG: DUF4197 domain-containing protein [Bacteroidota bacterium]
MKRKLIPTLAAIVITITACTSQTLQQQAAAAKAAAEKALQNTTGTGAKPLSNDEVVKGLKEALTVGTNNSTGIASKLDGYYKNPKLFIPFPPEAKKVKETVDALGLKPQTDKFVMTLNRAAEEAAKNAAPVFIAAVKGMNVADGFKILKGADNAATQYLKDKTTAELKVKFTPIVKAAIDKVQVTKYWNPIITKYNKIPMVQKQNPDLTAYVTEKAMAGLFLLLADEELKIRKDPMARVNDLLKRVFGGN